MRNQQEVSLDEITQVINKLEGKLKDDRLSEELRNSNVTIYEQRPPRYYNQYVNQIPNNYQLLRHQRPEPTTPQSQSPQNSPYNHQQFSQYQPQPQYTQPVTNLPSRPFPQSQEPLPPLIHPTHPTHPNDILIHRIRSLQQKLQHYQSFQHSARQNSRKNEQQLEKLISIINYQQNEIVSLEAQNNEIQYELRQGIETQKVLEEELAAYKVKVVALERATAGGRTWKGGDAIIERVGGSKDGVFREMMKQVEGTANKGRVGSPPRAGITLSGKKLP